jgi:predicted AAA+ superfamily ATPase
MLERPIWNERLASAWSKAPIVWLTGVRRAGKTVLARSVTDAEFLNCDLPSTVERLRDPEVYFRSAKHRIVVLDEIHQLPDPSRILKIAADAFPRLKVLATGSSTLAATKKFKDSLTGRKRVVELVPVLFEELATFGITDLEERVRRGGLPQALLADQPDPGFYSEWMDSYFARDVQELFHLEKRAAFLKLLELVLRQSGGMADFTTLAKHAGVSRPTVMSWLEIFQVTHVVHALRPFSEGGRREIVAQPKLYGFDTGFVCHVRGLDTLRAEDCGALWEHLVLETLLSIPVEKIHFWRDKQQREIDFVLPRARGAVDAIECKWHSTSLEPRNLIAFRESYAKGANYLVCPDVRERQERRFGNVDVTLLPLGEFRQLFRAR